MAEKKRVSQKDSIFVFVKKKKKPRNQNDVITVCVPRHVTCTKFSNLGL